MRKLQVSLCFIDITLTQLSNPDSPRPKMRLIKPWKATTERIQNTDTELQDAQHYFAAITESNMDVYQEQVFEFVFEFESFLPRLIPTQDSTDDNPIKTKDLHWGLTTENEEGSFLKNGHYTVSIQHDHRKIDFVNMSRALVQEGTELWINMTPDIYKMIIDQANDQGMAIALPVSRCRHDALLNKDLGKNDVLLRAFYTLGGSYHDKSLMSNVVKFIIIVASKRSVAGKKGVFDDHATADSIVNRNVGPNDYKFISVSIPIYLEDQQVFTFDRNPDRYFYKYLKEDTVSRNR